MQTENHDSVRNRGPTISVTKPARIRAVLLGLLAAAMGAAFVANLLTALARNPDAPDWFLPLTVVVLIVLGVGFRYATRAAGHYWEGEIDEARPFMNIAAGVFCFNGAFVQFHLAMADPRHTGMAVAVALLALAAWNAIRFWMRTRASE